MHTSPQEQNGWLFNKVSYHWIPGQRKSLRLSGSVTLLWLITHHESFFIFSLTFSQILFCICFNAVSHSKFLIPLYFHSILYFQIAFDISLSNFIDLSQDLGFVLIINSLILYQINSSAYLYEFLPFAFLRFPLWFCSFT